MGDALYEAALDKVVQMIDPLSRISLPKRFIERQNIYDRWFWQCVDITVDRTRSHGGRKMEEFVTQDALRVWLAANMTSRWETTPAGVEFHLEDDAMLFYMRFK
jgi:hypothetical protein